jgi:hypothetical protein
MPEIKYWFPLCSHHMEEIAVLTSEREREMQKWTVKNLFFFLELFFTYIFMQGGACR